MKSNRLKSRTFRRVFRKTPGGRNVVHFKRRRPAKPTCPITLQPLQGVARGTPAQIRKLTRSQRKPNRKFGGYLSSTAARRWIIEMARL